MPKITQAAASCNYYESVIYFMILKSFALFILAFGMQTPAIAFDNRYEQICYFNDSPKNCWVNHGYRVPLTKGSNVDIHWQDGQITTLRYINTNAPLKKGDRVIVNSQFKGHVSGFFNNTRKGAEIDNYVRIKSSSGNSFSFQYIMD